MTMVLNFLHPEDRGDGGLVTMVLNITPAKNIVVRGSCDHGNEYLFCLNRSGECKKS